jgi:hypothetical protein
MKNEDTIPSFVNDDLSAGFRYIVYIYFGLPKNHLAEGVKTLKEARTYKQMIDQTVKKACIIDKANGRIVEWWVS